MSIAVRAYFEVVQVRDGWAIRGGAFAGRNFYEVREDALKEARRMAHGLYIVTNRPTGVRIQLNLCGWEDVELFGQEPAPSPSSPPSIR